jgi:hypothetical protein
MIALLTGAAVFKAYSDEGCRRKRGGKGVGARQQQACKGRANCLKPKETGKAAE